MFSQVSIKNENKSGRYDPYELHQVLYIVHGGGGGDRWDSKNSAPFVKKGDIYTGFASPVWSCSGLPNGAPFNMPPSTSSENVQGQGGVFSTVHELCLLVWHWVAVLQEHNTDTISPFSTTPCPPPLYLLPKRRTKLPARTYNFPFICFFFITKCNVQVQGTWPECMRSLSALLVFCEFIFPCFVNAYSISQHIGFKKYLLIIIYSKRKHSYNIATHNAIYISLGLFYSACLFILFEPQKPYSPDDALILGNIQRNSLIVYPGKRNPVILL